MLPITTPLAAWTVVLLSGVLEVLFAVTMKLSDGYTRPLLTLVSLTAATLSVWLVAQTLAVLPLGTAYAVWAGMGAVGTAAVGMVVFGESATPLRLACMGAVVLGIVGLQLQGPA